MGILGITNRTEDWKTVRHFHGLDDDAKIKLVTELGEPNGITAPDIQIELFWKGMRDYLNKPGTKNQSIHADLAERYRHLFPNLREEIEEFSHKTRKDSKLSSDNYIAQTEKQENYLYNNLMNTETDIVIETPDHLFIGEAKHETRAFNTDGRILRHQLIREYAMATILIHCVESNKKVVPFVIGDDSTQLMKSYRQQQHIHQLDFMIKQHKLNRSPGDWLKRANVLSWNCIRKITNPESTHDNCPRNECNE